MDPINVLETIPIVRFFIRWILERKLEVTVLSVPEPKFYSYQFSTPAPTTAPSSDFVGISPPPFQPLQLPKATLSIVDFQLRIVNNRHDRPLQIRNVEILSQRRKRFRWSKPHQVFSFGSGGTRMYYPADSQDEIRTLSLDPVSEKIIRVLNETSILISPGKHERLLVKLEFIGDIRRVTRKLVTFKRFY